MILLHLLAIILWGASPPQKEPTFSVKPHMSRSRKTLLPASVGAFLRPPSDRTTFPFSSSSWQASTYSHIRPIARYFVIRAFRHFYNGVRVQEKRGVSQKTGNIYFTGICWQNKRVLGAPLSFHGTSGKTLRVLPTATPIGTRLRPMNRKEKCCAFFLAMGQRTLRPQRANRFS